MPAVRLMNWNIQIFGQAKADVPGMIKALAQTILNVGPDILLIVELPKDGGLYALKKLSNELAAQSANATDYTGAFYSFDSGGERYGVIIKNMDAIRPVVPYNAALGSVATPIGPLQGEPLRTWPAPFGTSAYPVPLARPEIPLTTPFADPVSARSAKKASAYAGVKMDASSYTAGKGSRLPMLAMFSIYRAAADGGPFLVPVLACHYAAVRDSKKTRNHLAQGQVAQMKFFDAVQRFDDGIAGAAQREHYVCVDSSAMRVGEICITGDFNLDFRNNNTVGGPLSIPVTNHNAYLSLTPTLEEGGSNTPAAAAPPAVVPPDGCPPLVPGKPREENVIPAQVLKAAITTRETIMYDPGTTAEFGFAPPYGDTVFDNFFYGGTKLAAATHPIGLDDAGFILSVPTLIGNQKYAGLQLQAAIYAYANDDKKYTRNCGSLLKTAVIKDYARLIGARLLSDHLPTYLQFDI